MTASTEVTYEFSAGVAVITLNRPASRNALTMPMVEQIIDGVVKALGVLEEKRARMKAREPAGATV